jgi:hypothetical protein
MDPQAPPRTSRGQGFFYLSEADSTGQGRVHRFRRRAALARYFARRHQRHERLRLLTLIATGGKRRVDFNYRVRRDADDLRAVGIDGNRIALGKGAALCASRKIFYWSMTHPDERVTGPKCPGGVQACRQRR